MRRQERFDPEVPALACVRQSGERPVERRPIKVVDARDRRPVVDLVFPANPPAEIDAPDAAAAALESQRLERNSDLGRPAVGSGPRGDGPYGIPARVHLAAFVGNLRVGFRAERVDGEDVAIAPIGEGVEDHLEAVLLAGREILSNVVDDDAARRGIAAEHADVERVAVEGDAHFGRFGGRLALMRLGLHEVGGRHADPPNLLVERAVERHGGPRFDGRHHAAAIGRSQLKGRRRDRRKQ